jgi:branched-chain amino acid transport system permease protein
VSEARQKEGEDFMTLYLTSQLFNGIVLGILYTLLALGLTLIVGVMEVINFSHIVLFALGAYMAMEITPHLGFGWALIFAPLIVGAFGMILEVLFFRRIYGKDPLYGLLIAFGLTCAITESIRWIWGSQGYPFNPPQALTGFLNLGFMNYSKYRVFVGGLTWALIIAMWLFLERTTVGMVIKAGVSDAEMVGALGKNLKKVRTLVFAIGSIFAGMSGVLMAPMQGIKPDMGTFIIMPAFVVLVVGGIGSFWGSVIGGILVGISTTLAVMIVPRVSDLAMFVLLVLVILTRPRGLMGEKSGLEA